MSAASRAVTKISGPSGVRGSTVLLAGAALIGALSASSGAQAQCVNSDFTFAAFNFSHGIGRNIIPTANPLVSITNTVNTAFLTNTTSFVSAPPNAQPNQGSGGVWARSIAGYLDTEAQSLSVVAPGQVRGVAGQFYGSIGGSTDGSGGSNSVIGGVQRGTQTCSQSNHQEYAGVQIGADLATLNIGKSGANLHFGVTGGYLASWAQDTTPAGGDYPAGDMKSRFEVPFIGLYAAFTQGNFFADAQVRWDFYESHSSSFLQDFSGVKNEARAFTVAGNLGYKIPLASNWFLEPSVGGSYSRVKSDPVTFVSDPTLFFSGGGTVDIDDFESILGRATLRLGANISQGIYTWQPFISASVIHEFAGDVTSKITLIQIDKFPNVGFPSPNGLQFNVATDRFGTYGQFGLGTAIVVGNTGWLGYGRGDIKFGENVQGAGFNVGLRYQW